MHRDRELGQLESAVGAEPEMSSAWREVDPSRDGDLMGAGYLDGQGGDPRHPLDQTGDEIGMQVLDDQYRRLKPGQSRRGRWPAHWVRRSMRQSPPPAGVQVGAWLRRGELVSRPPRGCLIT